MITVHFEKQYNVCYVCTVEAETLEEAIEIAKGEEFEHIDSDLCNVNYFIEDSDEEGDKYMESTNLDQEGELPLDGWR